MQMQIKVSQTILIWGFLKALVLSLAPDISIISDNSGTFAYNDLLRIVFCECWIFPPDKAIG